MQRSMNLVLTTLILTTLLYSQNLDSLRKTINSMQDKERIDALNTIANEFKYKSTDSVLYYSSEALKLAEELEYLQGESEAYANFAFVYTYNGDKISATEYIQKAIAIDKSIYDKTNELKNTIFLANIYLQFGEYNLAATKYLTALKYFEETQDTFQIAQIKSNLGIVYGNINDIKNSIKYLKDSAELKRKINDKYGEFIAYSNIGYFYQKDKKYTEALTYIKKSLNYYLEINKNGSIAGEYSNLGKCYYELGDYKEALTNLELSIKYSKKTGNILDLAEKYNHIAEIYLKLNQFSNCKKYLDGAAKILNKTNNQYYLAENSRLFFNYYLAKNNRTKALEYFESYNSIKDSINSLKKHKTISELRTKYETEKKDIENEQLKNTLENETRENLLQTRLTLTASILLILLLVSGTLIYRSLKQKNKLLQQENRIKEIEKESMRQEIIAKQQAEFSRKLLENQEQERERIAGELHDGIGHDLIIANNKILLGIKENEQIKKDELLNSATDHLNKLSDDVSRISHELHPQELTQLGFGMTIESMVNRIKEVSDIKFHLNLGSTIDLLNKEEEINYFRIIQESLNNALKHSEAKNVWINISQETDRIDIEIVDDGKGFDKNFTESNNRNRPHFGLRSMTQRANILGGELKIVSKLNAGTTIKITTKNGKNI